MSSQDESNISLSKKGQREVSPFIGHELLYDYVTGSLDPERRAAVADHLKFSRDAQLDLEKIQNGQNYATKLSETVVSQVVMEKINTPSTYVTVLLQKTQFEKWPQGVKWGLEALFVVAAMVLVLTLTPWQKVFEWGQGLSSQQLILSEVPKSETITISEEKPDFIDEELPNPTPAKATTPVAPVATKSPTIKASVAPTVSPGVPVKPEPAPSVVASAKPTSTPTPTSSAATAEIAETTASGSATPSGGGFLYRGQLNVSNLVATGQKITETIASLGGRKAGSVELGWQKTPTSIYYHFTIPENKYAEFLAFLQTYGPVKLVKEKHPRVMPDGIFRVILTVDEGPQ